ncbi:hypothetical protein L3Q82_016631, partial [Scortum barcoo]
PEKCAPDEPAELHWIGASMSRPVAARIEGVWRADPDYEGRVSEEPPRFTFSRSVYTDTGLYQLTCGGLSAEIHLNVLFGFDASVSEGGPVRLDCHYSTSGSHVDSVRWEKDGKVVLERSLSSGKTEGSEPRASFPPGGDRDGDWSLLLDAARRRMRGTTSRLQAWGEPAATWFKMVYSGAFVFSARLVAEILFMSQRAVHTCDLRTQANETFNKPTETFNKPTEPQQTNGDLQQANGDLQQDPQQTNRPSTSQQWPSTRGLNKPTETLNNKPTDQTVRRSRINVPCEMSLLEIKNEGAPPPEDDAFP